MWGYSAGGVHHPLHAAAPRTRSGSLRGRAVPCLPSPLSKIHDQSARYPIGVADLKQLTGKKFNAKAFRRVPIQVFRGGADNNDEVAFADGYDMADRDFINPELGGPPPIERHPAIQALYRRAAPQVTFTIEPGVAHSDVLTPKETPIFFEQHRR